MDRLYPALLRSRTAMLFSVFPSKQNLLVVLFGLCILVSAACKKGSEQPSSPTPAPEPTKSASAIRFEDVTESSGVTFVHVTGAAGKKWMPETMGSGVA